jgi:hypothetical protein
MTVGQCKLCGQHKELRQSHVWSRFGYKDYAADLAKGGRFVDLGKRRVHHKQYIEEWLCEECEAILGQTESYTAQLLRRLEARPDAPQEYDHRLHKFVVSMSWRIALYHLHGQPGRANAQVKPALKLWREYLLGKKREVRSFSQHLFVVFDKEAELHKGLGGELYLDDGFVLSHVGPLFMVGLLGRSHLSLSDIKVWEASELHPAGGTITPIREWHVGKRGNATYKLTLRLYQRVCLAIKARKEMHAAGQV